MPLVEPGDTRKRCNTSNNASVDHVRYICVLRTPCPRDNVRRRAACNALVAGCWGCFCFSIRAKRQWSWYCSMRRPTSTCNTCASRVKH
eukprot:12936342-Prorocentrum_lima.AAC.1